VPGSAQTTAWPQRPIRIIVPYPASGSTDILGRFLAQRISARLEQTVLVENRGGASGTIGSDAVAKAAPDGYTLLFTSGGPLAVAPSLLRSIPYNAATDFTPVTLLAQAPSLLAVLATSPITDVAGLIAAARARPGTLSIGSPGTGTSVHLIGEMFRLQADIQVEAVTYRGGAPALQDLLGGRLSFMFENLVQLLPLVRAGLLRPLAVTSARRVAAAPEIPTLDEAGLTGFEGSTWFGLLAPRGLPQAIADRLANHCAGIIDEPETRRLLAEQGTEADIRAGERFAAFMEADRTRWRDLIARAGIQPI
jgi:tripartite-type tricarboxylate transporter receptor subunit TctC